MTCTRCKNPNLGKEDFYKSSRNRSGLQAWCKFCARAAQKKASRDYRERHPEVKRRDHLKARYQLTVKQYEELLRQQGGRCANLRCDNGWVALGKPLHVDHDHKTGKVRGLLCQPCNQALGLLNDDPSRIRGLAEYGTRHA